MNPTELAAIDPALEWVESNAEAEAEREYAFSFRRDPSAHWSAIAEQNDRSAGRPSFRELAHADRERSYLSAESDTVAAVYANSLLTGGRSR